MSFFRYCLIYIPICILFSCKSGLDTRGTTSYKSSINEASFTNIPIVAGHRIDKLKVESHGAYWNYDINIPVIQPNSKVPLVIVLHGGIGSKNYTQFSDCLATPGLKDTGGIIFSPSGAWRTWTLAHLEKRILDFIDLAKKHWPVDPKRIILLGYSNGAIAGWQYAKKHSTIFSAMILMASSCKVTEKLNIPIYVIQGTEDRFFPIRKARKRITEAQALGCDITFIPVQGNTHLKACEYTKALQGSTDWLHHTVWSTNSK